MICKNAINIFICFTVATQLWLKMSYKENTMYIYVHTYTNNLR